MSGFNNQNHNDGIMSLLSGVYSTDNILKLLTEKYSTINKLLEQNQIQNDKVKEEQNAQICQGEIQNQLNQQMLSLLGIIQLLNTNPLLTQQLLINQSLLQLSNPLGSLGLVNLISIFLI